MDSDAHAFASQDSSLRIYSIDMLDSITFDKFFVIHSVANARVGYWLCTQALARTIQRISCFKDMLYTIVTDLCQTTVYGWKLLFAFQNCWMSRQSVLHAFSKALKWCLAP
jgi:hypothetical protein